jgi:glycosyltransferase involved in cell wall biosynthesis
MNVWVFNQFAGSPFNSSGAGERYHFMAQHWDRNHQVDVTIFSASYNHLFINQPQTKGNFTVEYIDDIRYCWVRVPRYSPDSGIGRFISWIIFMLRLFVIHHKDIPRPDRIIVSSMSMFPIYPALIKKLFSKGKIKKVIFEIRDIWPLTLIEIGGFSKFNPVIVLLNLTEWVAYRFADNLISVLPYADNHIQSKMKRKIPVVWIPNGIDVDSFEVTSKTQSNTWKERFENKIVVTYAGAVGKANALDYFLAAHESLSSPSKFIFLILGTGPELDYLKKKFSHNRAIVFAGKIPKMEVQSVLRQSDILFIGWHKLPIYRFGVSANKYSDYMLARRPIISSGDLAYDPVEKADCGVVVEAENPTKIAKAIDCLSKLSADELQTLGDRGYQYLMRNNSMTVLSEKFYALLEL